MNTKQMYRLTGVPPAFPVKWRGQECWDAAGRLVAVAGVGCDCNDAALRGMGAQEPLYSGSNPPPYSAPSPTMSPAQEAFNRMRLQAINGITVPVMNAIDRAAPIIAQAGAAVTAGNMASVPQLQDARNALELIKSGSPPTAAMPNGWMGYRNLGLSILGVPSPSALDPTDQAGQMYTVTLTKLDKWALSANDILMRNGTPPAPFGDSNGIWRQFVDALRPVANNAVELASKSNDMAKSAAKAAKKGVKGAADLSSTFGNLSKTLKDWSKNAGAGTAILTIGGVLLVGLLGIAAAIGFARK